MFSKIEEIKSVVAAPPPSASECSLLGHGVLGNVLDGVRDGLDLLGIVVRNVKDELLLEGHDNLNNIEGVEAEVVHEVGLGGDLGGINLLEVLDDLEDAGEDVLLVEEVLAGAGLVAGGGISVGAHGDELGAADGGGGEGGNTADGHGGNTAGGGGAESDGTDSAAAEHLEVN